MELFEELERRGLVAQMTNPEKIKEVLNGKAGVPFYMGFDATADSLHVGHFLALSVMKRMQMAGHRPIALLGTATTMIGDPTGKTDMRPMLTPEQIDYNVECFKRQMSRFIEFGEDKARIVKNGDWILPMNYMDFLRDVGVHFSVNKMLTAECFKSRLEGKGLSFLEFNYMLMQSYDFLHLYDTAGCCLEMGGDDQWSNILGGVDLIRRVRQKEVCGMTVTLLTTREGKKMGKTEKGALWLDAEKTSPYEFFQYWRNVADDDVIRCLKLLTFVPVEEIEQMERSMSGADFNSAKELLAYELTRMVHGEEEAGKAREAARTVFAGGGISADMPTTVLTEADFAEGKIGVLTAAVRAGLGASNGEVRRMIQGKGLAVDDVVIEDPAYAISAADFEKGHVILRKGKKVYHKLVKE